MSRKWRQEAILRKRFDFVLPLGTDTELFHPRDEKSLNERVRFLFVSRLESEKGIIRLLQAWKMAGLTNAELHIAGTGSLVELVKSGAYNRVFYHGILSNQDLAALYRSCDVFVFPTQGEIYGLVVLEALASGLFAIVSQDLRGNFDSFERMGQLEYIQNDPLAISLKMAELASNPTLQGDRKKAYQFIKTNNDWRSVAACLFSIFDQILQRRDQH